MVGQDKGCICNSHARFCRKFEQEDSFPRNKVNKDIFFDNQWDINKERQNAQYLKQLVVVCLNKEDKKKA